jgi:LacI family transcriptional regulator
MDIYPKTPDRSKMAATLKDVARAAGVSAATVSRVMQDNPRISEKTKVRVRVCVAELGYTVNNIARSLKTSRTRIIGFICPELTNSFFMQVAKGVEDELKKAGYSLIICNSGENAEEETNRLHLLIEQCVDGIILVPATRTGAHFAPAREAGIPVVLVDRTVDDFPTDAVLVDNINGSYAATEALLADGHRRIAFIGGDHELTNARERDEGYRRALADYHVLPEEAIIRYGDFHVESGFVLMKELMEMTNPPDTVFIANYFMYLGATRYLLGDGTRRHRDGQLPREAVTVANFDNLEYLSVFGGSQIVVEQPMQALGQQAAQLLLNRIRGDKASFPHLIRLKTKLLFPGQVNGN